MIFADEAEARLYCEGAFEQRGRVNANLELEAGAGRLPDKIDELSELFFYEGMVVLVVGVCSDKTGRRTTDDG